MLVVKLTTNLCQMICLKAQGRYKLKNMQSKINPKHLTVCKMVEVTRVKLVMVVVQAMVENVAMEDVIVHSPKVRAHHLRFVNFVVNVTH